MWGNPTLGRVSPLTITPPKSGEPSEKSRRLASCGKTLALFIHPRLHQNQAREPGRQHAMFESRNLSEGGQVSACEQTERGKEGTARTLAAQHRSGCEGAVAAPMRCFKTSYRSVACNCHRYGVHIWPLRGSRFLGRKVLFQTKPLAHSVGTPPSRLRSTSSITLSHLC